MSEDTISITNNQLHQLFAKLEGRVETQEILIANLAQGFMEMWATLEIIINDVVGARTQTEREAFAKQMADVRAQMWQNIKDIGEHGVEGLDPDLRSAVEHLVSGVQPDVGTTKHSTDSGEPSPS